VRACSVNFFTVLFSRVLRALTYVPSYNHLYTNPSPTKYFIQRSRENCYITRCCCNRLFLFLPLVRSTSQTPTTTACMTEDFRDDFKSSTGACHR
jgi:hypothetical protein